ncbi:Mitochondrial dicarboxylate transporter [Aspergillus fumigatus]
MAGSGKLEESQQAARAAVKKVHYPFWFGGSASCFAAMVTHPLDLVKVYLLVVYAQRSSHPSLSTLCTQR